MGKVSHSLFSCRARLCPASMGASHEDACVRALVSVRPPARLAPPSRSSWSSLAAFLPSPLRGESGLASSRTSRTLRCRLGYLLFSIQLQPYPSHTRSEPM
eukprot:6194645-Pleurochrysis_carterae.AAC.2